MDYRLNPVLDAAALARAYAVKGRLQIRDVLTADSAERVLHHLANDTAWGVAFNQGAEVVQLSQAQAAALTAEQQHRLGAAINDGARAGYQFFYHHFPLLTAYFTPGHPHLPLFDVFEFVNSAAFLGFVRQLTGRTGIRWADAHATLFRAGHFLKYHTDEKPEDRRACAYVLNFTKGWGRDWGGFLNFYDERYDVEQGLRPVFNALNIFTVPAHHSVTQVAGYAPGNRFCITGWLREDDPPRPIGHRS